jgi:hypothetical protein
MYLATVTCDRDFSQLLLQAESIQKFLEPCKHVIIINEYRPDFDFYKRWLEPYYTKHELVLLPRIDYSYPIEGFKTSLHNSGTAVEWRRQQLQKLLLAYEFEDDYVLLDSKNFFVKDTSLMYYNNFNFYGSGYSMEVRQNDPHFKITFETYKTILKVSQCTKTTGITTPYKIHRNLLIDRIKKEELGYYLFAPEYIKDGVTSEFMFYSVLIHDKIAELKEHHPTKTFWAYDPHPDHLYKELQLLTNNQTFVIGFHRDFLNTISQEHLDIINNWLKDNVGLKNRLHAMPRDMQMSNYKI